MTNHRVTASWKANDLKTVFFARNGLTADGPCYASARYEPAGPISCPRSGGSAAGRRKHRPPRSRYSFDNLDRLPGWFPKASDRWLPTQATTCRDLPVLPPHETSRTSPSSAGRRVSATGGRTVPMETPYSLGRPRRRTRSGQARRICSLPNPGPHRPHRPCRGTAGSLIDSVRS